MVINIVLKYQGKIESIKKVPIAGLTRPIIFLLALLHLLKLLSTHSTKPLSAVVILDSFQRYGDLSISIFTATDGNYLHIRGISQSRLPLPVNSVTRMLRLSLRADVVPLRRPECSSQALSRALCKTKAK